MILKHPAELELSGNLTKFIVSMASQFPFRLKKGTDIILEQIYDPGISGQVEIDVREVIESYLSFKIQDSDSVFEQSNIISSFTAEVDSQTIEFKVIRSGVDNLTDTASNFLRSNFLTWQPQRKKITYYSPEFLTYYAQDSSSVCIDAYYADGSTETKVFASLQAGKAYTIPCQYAIINSLLTKKMPGYFDVYVKSASGTRLTYMQRFIASSKLSEDEQWILFENSLGGCDTFRAYGQYELTADHTHNIAKIGDDSSEYRVDTTRKYKKNTGFLDSYERKWLLDFFPSKRKFIYEDQGIRQIVVSESDASFISKELPTSYSFTYRYSSEAPFLNLSRTPLPAEVVISAPDHESFTLPPRLVDFPKLNLSEGAIVLIQSPYSENWGITTLGALIDFFGNDIIERVPDPVEIIAQFDSTELSDINVLSALRSKMEFVSKRSDDIVEGHLTLKKGLTTDFVKSSDLPNTGYKLITLQDGTSSLEVDKLKVRMSASINVLTIAELKSVGGQIILSSAEIKCTNVISKQDCFRCYFNNDSGNIINPFVVGDQARCQRFTGSGLKYYWRRVDAVGTDYVDLSKTDCDGDGIPDSGDSIVQLGNRDLPDRQNAILISAYGSDSPSIKQYSGINSFSLIGCERTVLSPSGNKIVGNFTFQSGENVQDIISQVSNVATSTKEKVDTLKVGGRNYLPGTSGSYLSLVGWNQDGWYGSLSLTSKGIMLSAKSGWRSIQRSFQELAGKEVTLSGKIRFVDTPVHVPIFVGTGFGSYWNIAQGPALNASDSFSSFAETFTLDSSGNFVITVRQADYSSDTASVEFVELKLELGNQATDYSPAPEDIQNALNNQTSYVEAIKSSLQLQIDGQIISHFQEYNPTVANYPASDWTTDAIKQQHANDTFTNTLTGACWRWQQIAGSWGWGIISDTATQQALTAASRAQDTADKKRRIFSTQPTTPYDAGDLWPQGATGDILICITPRTSTDSFRWDDWDKSSKYTDDSALMSLVIGGRNLLTAPTKALHYIGPAVAIKQWDIRNLQPETNYTISFRHKANLASNPDITSTAWLFNNDWTWSKLVSVCKQDEWLSVTLTFRTPILSQMQNGLYFAIYLLGWVTGWGLQYGEIWAENVQLELGDKATDYSPAPDDFEVAIAEAKTIGNNALSSATTANTAVQNLSSYVDTSFHDGLIDSSEAKAIEKYINTISSEYSAAITSYNAVYSNTYLTGQEKTDLLNAKINLVSTKDSLIAAINNAIADGKTTIAEKQAVDAAYSAYVTYNTEYVAKLEIANKVIQAAIDSSARTYTDSIQISGRNLFGFYKSHGFEVASIAPNYSENGFSFVAQTAGILLRITRLSLDNIPGNFVVSGYIKSSGYGSLNINICDVSSPDGNISLTTSYTYFSRRIKNVQAYLTSPYFCFIDFESNTTAVGQIIYLKDFKIERGDKATGWSAAPEDLSYQLSASANALTELASDSKLTPLEKTSAKKEYDSIVNTCSKLVSQATYFAISSDTLLQKYNTLVSYMAPLLQSLSTTSDIVYSDFKTKINDFYSAAEDVRAAINSKSKTTADSALSTAQTALSTALSTGGRNLIGQTPVAEAYGAGNSIIINGETGPVINSIQRNAHHLTYSSAGSLGMFRFLITFCNPITEAGFYTLSFYYRFANGMSLSITPQINDLNLNNYIYETAPSTDWKYFSGSVWVNPGVHGFVDLETNQASAWMIDIACMKVEKGTEATSWTPAPEETNAAMLQYLKDAIAQEASGAGGLSLLSLLLLRNAGGNITAGLSGLDDNVGMFAGGTYEQALADCERAFKSDMQCGVLDKKDGSGHRAFGSFAWNIAKEVYVKGVIEAISGKFGLMQIIGSSIIGDHLKITNEPVELKSVATSAHTYTIPYSTQQQNLSPTNPILVMETEAVLFENDTTISAYLRNYTSFSLPAIFSDNTPVGATLGFKLEVINNDNVVGSNSSSWIAVGSGYTNSYSDGASVSNIAISKGSVKLRSTIALGVTENWDPTDYLIVHPIITSSSSGAAQNINFSANIYRTMLGKDGLVSFTGANRWLYYRGAGDSNDEFELNIAGNKLGYSSASGWNMPGILAAGSVGSTGYKSNTWGAKSNSNAATKGGTGVYNVPHLAGSAYSVQVTPLTDNLIARVTSKGNNTFQVTIRNMSGTATDSAFDYTILGAN